MPKLSPAEIAQTAMSAGLSRDEAVTATAVALAESGGNTQAHNTMGLDNSYGLWQINMYGAMGPDRRRTFGIGSNEELFTPSVNARAMSHLSNGGSNWRPWTTYTRGTYLQHMVTARKAVEGATGTTTQPVGITDGLTSLIKAVDTLTSKEMWARIAIGFVGLLTLFVALVKLTGDNNLSDVTKTAAKLVVFRKVAK